MHVFCAVLAWSRFRFVRFAADEQAATTLAMLAECFEVLGGVPKVGAGRPDGLPEGRRGRQRGGARPPDYVRFATHYRFRPDFCEAADPESKGIVENLVGYAKGDLMVPLELEDDPWTDARGGQRRGARRGAPRSTPRCIRRSARSRPSGWPPSVELLGALPSLRLEVGPKPTTRKVDKLSCIRFGSARYSVPNRLIGTTVTVARRRRRRCG